MSEIPLTQAWDWQKEDLVQVPGGETQHLNTWDIWNVYLQTLSKVFTLQWTVPNALTQWVVWEQALFLARVF